MRRRIVTSVVLVVAAGVLASTGRTVAQDDGGALPRKPLAYLVPADTLALVTLVGGPEARADLESWSVARVLDDPAMRRLFAPCLDRWESWRDDADARAREAFGRSLVELADLVHGQIGIALIDADFRGFEDELRRRMKAFGIEGLDDDAPDSAPRDDRADRNGAPPEPPASDRPPPRVLIGIDIDRSTEAFASARAWLTRTLSADNDLTAHSYRGFEITRVAPVRLPGTGTDEAGDPEDSDDPPDSADALETPEMFWAIANRTVLLSFDLATLRAALDRYRAALPDGTLARSRAFRAVRAGLSPRGEVAFAYVNLPEYRARLRTGLSDETRAEADRAWTSSGLDRAQALGFSLVHRADEGVLENVYCYAPGTRRGLLRVVSQPATTFGGAVHAPADVVSFASARFDLAIAWVEFQRMFHETRPQDAQRLRDELDALADDGLNVVDGLFEALAGEVTLWDRSVNADAPMATTALFDVRDAESTRALLETLFKGLHERHPEFVLAPEVREGLAVYAVNLEPRRAEIVESLAQRADLREGVPEALDQFVAKTVAARWEIALVGARLVVTSEPDAIARLVEYPDGIEASFATSEAFAPVAALKPLSLTAVAWADGPRVVAHLYAPLVALAAALQAAAGDTPLPFVASAFPPMSTVRRHTRAGVIGYWRSTRQGIHVRSAGGLGAALAAGWLVRDMLPALRQPGAASDD